jgi:NAD(P)-dependent dehydrogenase (short-subunit alcohol dehydrogenase family)
MAGFSGCRMDRKVCVVSGATQGLGAAIARRLAAAGAKTIVFTGRNAERGAHLADALAETHSTARHISRGLTSAASKIAGRS